VKLPGVDPVTVILQKNTMKIDPENKMILEFDLKGSSFQRHTIPQELLSGKKRRVPNEFSTFSSKFLTDLPQSLQDFLTSNTLTLKDHDLVDLITDFNLHINIS